MHTSPTTTAVALPARRRLRAGSVVAAAVLVVLTAVGPSGAATSTRGATSRPTTTTVRRPSPPVPGAARVTTTSLRRGVTTTTSARRGPATPSTLAGAGSTSSTSSTTSTLPPDLKSEIELAIVDGQRAAAPGLRVARADCPASLRIARGQARSGTYECTVTIEGVRAPYAVVITREAGARTGTYALSPSKAIVDVSKVIAGIREDLDESERATAKIVCGRAKVIVAAPGGQISCSVTTGNITMPVRYVVKDLDGTIALLTE